MPDMLVNRKIEKGCLTFRRYGFSKDNENTLPEGSQLAAFLYTLNGHQYAFGREDINQLCILLSNCHVSQCLILLKPDAL